MEGGHCHAFQWFLELKKVVLEIWTGGHLTVCPHLGVNSREQFSRNSMASNQKHFIEH
jgi:hypothetical protein